MLWQLQIAKRVQKTLEKVPAKDQQRILAVLDEMAQNPLSGDIARLKADRSGFRRRIGSYRIFFDLYFDQHLINVVEVTRRTSSTY